MNQDDILEQLDITRERLLVALEPLSDEEMVKPGVAGNWSVAEVLVHLTVWESELVTALMQIDQGRRPSKFLKAYNNVEGYNTQRYRENKDRDLDRIFRDLQGVRLQLEQWLDDFSDREFEDPARYKWARGENLGQIIKECSFGHEAEHVGDIEELSRKSG